MNTSDVRVVRIYLTEGQKQYQQLISLLHDREQVRGMTVFRGISGFGKSGKMHASTLLDLSLDLPVVLEFFDRPEKVATVLEDLKNLVEPGHIVSWGATVNSGE
ncbi:MAG: DUF190 domain-containing protein [Gammaproteobacteria bacterium]|nr:DUF190 domain-containing protein [Gammaproteobacteria bacterium]